MEVAGPLGTPLGLAQRHHISEMVIIRKRRGGGELYQEEFSVQSYTSASYTSAERTKMEHIDTGCREQLHPEAECEDRGQGKRLRL